MMSSRIPVQPVKPSNGVGWSASTDKLVCVAVEDNAEDVRTYWFEGAEKQHFKYLPGQHIVLVLPDEAEEHYRVFTLSSTPTRPDRICVTVKTARQNGVTFWMREHVKPGVSVWAKGIGGHFGILAQPVEQLLLVGAGSGITPMISTLRWLYDRRETRPIVLIQQASNPASLIFNDELHQIARALPNLRLVQVISRVPEGQSWSGYVGRFSRALLGSLNLDLRHYDSFCCGPEGFMAHVKRVLAASGADMARYHDESFGVPEGAEVAQTGLGEVLESGESALKLTFDGRQLDLGPGELLLSVFKRNGISIPTGCKNGICGTCKVKLIDGAVDMNHRGGISVKEEQAGLILACCSRAKSSLQVAR